ncbi:MAG: hypothetical protein RL173_1940 [Fibrobacterota bacterium]|jgi:RNA polymerase sigma-70 factor (ECF subfamily)
MMEPTDEKLAEQVAAGDEQALALLVRRWEIPLRRYVLRRCWSCRNDVDDLLQEVFLLVYRHIHAFDPKLKFSSWIWRITHNAMVSQVRSHARMDPHVELDEALMIPNGIRTEEPCESSDLAREIAGVLEKMSPVLRDVFVLRFHEEKSYEEIGDILHLNANTVATRVKRAREFFVENAKIRGLSLGRDE